MEIQTGKYLTFLLGQEIYGLQIKKAKEIIGMMEFTHIPRTQNYIKGVINLRGKIIPIVDLRLKFGMEEKPYTDRTCIIIIEEDSTEHKRLVGVAVDSVSEVVNLQKGEIEPTPQFEARIEGDFLTGIGKMKDKVVLIIDIEQILHQEEFSNLKPEFTA